jgi:hypothetical protein
MGWVPSYVSRYRRQGLYTEVHSNIYTARVHNRYQYPSTLAGKGDEAFSKLWITPHTRWPKVTITTDYSVESESSYLCGHNQKSDWAKARLEENMVWTMMMGSLLESYVDQEFRIDSEGYLNTCVCVRMCVCAYVCVVCHICTYLPSAVGFRLTRTWEKSQPRHWKWKKKKKNIASGCTCSWIYQLVGCNVVNRLYA